MTLIRIREMRCSDLAFATECAQASGRISVSSDEVESSLLCDGRGCWIAEYGRKPSGFCVSRSYGKSGFLSEFVLGGARRKADIERELLDHAVKYLTHGGNTNIFAEVEGDSLSVFESAGFSKLCRILQFSGNVYGRCHQHVRRLKPVEISAIASLDRHSFRANRLHFLGRRYLSTPEFCLVLESNGKIGGYIMARRANGGVVVGPWIVSPDVDCPADLLEALAVEAGGAKLLLEVPETSIGSVALLRALNFVESPEPIWRMMLGSPSIVGQSESIFAIGSPFMG